MASMADTGAKPIAKSDGLINRGTYRFNIAGATTFIGLRAADPFLQYQILANGWGTSFLAKLGLSTIPLASTSIVKTGIRAIDALGLPLPRLILLGMATGSVAKQVFWLTYLMNEEFPPKSAAIVSAFNVVVDSLNSLLLVTAATSASLATPQISIPGTKTSLSLPIVVGTALYIVGLGLETVSEVQRKWFKDAPENRGKLCNSGLFAVARNVNYAGYTVWRVGYSLAAGGWIAGLLMGAQMVGSFVRASLPEIEAYMSQRYGEQWKSYQMDVPWRMFPGVY
jgi:protein-S-isoprenylcysteine O-methyltransferase Ste14